MTTSSAPSRPGYTSDGTRTAESLRETLQAFSDQVLTTSSCAFCDWTHVGTALEGRDAALKHRQKKHPDACIRKPRRQRRISKKSIRSAGEEEQIKVDAAEARRVRSEREQSEMLAKIERGRERDRAALAALDGQIV
jgi:hypothetical protein